MNIFLLILFILFSILILIIGGKLNNSILKWLVILPFCLLVSNRDVDVPDTDVYISFYENEDPSFSEFANAGYEVGFQALIKSTKLVFYENYILFFGLLGILNLWLVTSATSIIFKNNDQLAASDIDTQTYTITQFLIFALLLHISYYGLYFNTIVLRVGVASSLLIFISSIAIKNDKSIIDYILLILLSILDYYFHATSVISVVILGILFFSKQYKLSTYYICLSIIGIFYFLNLTRSLGGSVFDNLVVSLNALEMLSNKLDNYSGSSDIFQATGVAMKFVYFWLMGFVLVKSKNASAVFYKYLNVYIFGLILYSLFRSIQLIERVTDFFFMFSFILYSFFLSSKRGIYFWIYLFVIISIQMLFILRIINQ